MTEKQRKDYSAKAKLKRKTSSFFISLWCLHMFMPWISLISLNLIMHCPQLNSVPLQSTLFLCSPCFPYLCLLVWLHQRARVMFGEIQQPEAIQTACHSLTGVSHQNTVTTMSTASQPSHREMLISRFTLRFTAEVEHLQHLGLLGVQVSYNPQ